jgi:hypothetical protein
VVVATVSNVVEVGLLFEVLVAMNSTDQLYIVISSVAKRPWFAGNRSGHNHQPSPAVRERCPVKRDCFVTMSASATPWTGTWIEVDDSLVTKEDLVLALASRRGCASDTVSKELSMIDEYFDVDAVYIERD